MSASHNGVMNSYRCPCGCTWEDEWDCGCDDDCPKCGTVCSPTESDERGPCVHPECYDRQCEALEESGDVSRSDAQGILDAALRFGRWLP